MPRLEPGGFSTLIAIYTKNTIRVYARRETLWPSRFSGSPWTMITSLLLAQAALFSLSSAPPRPLIRSRLVSSTWSAPSIVISTSRSGVQSAITIPSDLACPAVGSDVEIAVIRKPRAARPGRLRNAKAAVEPDPGTWNQNIGERTSSIEYRSPASRNWRSTVVHSRPHPCESDRDLRSLHFGHHDLLHHKYIRRNESLDS